MFVTRFQESADAFRWAVKEYPSGCFETVWKFVEVLSGSTGMSQMPRERPFGVWNLAKALHGLPRSL